MNWTINDINIYYQSVLNMIPIQTAGCQEKFYDEVIDSLDRAKILQTLPDNEYKASLISNSVSYVSIAMFPDESRWTCAYLLHDSIRPKKLKVKKNWTVDKILFKKENDSPADPDSDLNNYYPTYIVSTNNDQIYLKKGGEIIITAGSFGTPAILQRSGIGPKQLLSDLNIFPIHVNEEVGHGVDHPEVPVSYSWLDKWKEQNGSIPRGGPMAWPLAMFFDDNHGKSIMAHFGISPPPYEDCREVTGTPNCSSPDTSKGFFAHISSTNPSYPMKVTHIESEKDISQISRGVKKMVEVFDFLKNCGIVGERIQPPKEIDINNDKQINAWIKNNLGTAYHWMSTCKAGKNSIVADEKFKLRGVQGIRIGSGAVLPEIPEANPHLTISAFSVALAHSIVREKSPYIVSMDADGFVLKLLDIRDLSELNNARKDLLANQEKLIIRRVDDVEPNLKHILNDHIKMIGKRENNGFSQTRKNQ
jgi:hypothetical protein